MRVPVVLVIAMLLFATASAAAEAVLVLPETITVDGDGITWTELGARDAGAWATACPLSVPAPGHAKRWTRQAILRECVRLGVDPLPRFEGAERVEIRRSGAEVAASTLERHLTDALGRSDLPAGAIDQRFHIERLPRLSVQGGIRGLRLEADPPRVGRGSVAFTLDDGSGRHQRGFVSVTRELLGPVYRSVKSLEAGTTLGPAHVECDTTWVGDRVVWDRHLRPEQLAMAWTLQRAVRGGHLLTDRDVRPAPVVHRGENVRWVVERNGLRITLSARARGSGAVGDWILVQSPLDGRLHRVCILGPAQVADHLPEAEVVQSPTEADANLGGRR
jgi:flagella basal body P-ring formation protein FlgA